MRLDKPFGACYNKPTSNEKESKYQVSMQRTIGR
mgnify:CR=1 FL=1